MLDPSDVTELLKKDKNFLKLKESDQKFVVDMTIGKVEQFIVNLLPANDEDERSDDASR